MKQSRQVAFEVLMQMIRVQSYSNLALDAALEKEQLDARDAALTSALVYGVLERQITLDNQLSLYLTQPMKRLKPEVLTALRIGAYQLLFLNKIPHSAAVNESVTLVRSNKSAFAAGLVNAVLRRMAQQGLKLPKMVHNDIKVASVYYSCPLWLAKLWTESYGYDTACSIMEASLGRPPLSVRVNTLRSSPDSLCALLQQEGVHAQRHPLCESALLLDKTGDIELLSSFQDGLFHVQDVASQLCCMALDAQPGDTVLDICAAPGGKSFTLAQQMENRGHIYAYDLYEQRTGLIASGAKKLGLSVVHAEVADACAYRPVLENTADRILCDVPCSGLGIIRRKPEIRYKDQEELDKLPDLQYRILSVSARYLKPGGRLVYSTCTLHPAENDQICEQFLKQNPSFRRVPVLPAIPRAISGEKWLTLMPHLHETDGFFLAAFERTE